MNRLWIQMALLTAGLLPAAHGDFQLFLVEGSSEQAAPPMYSLGTVFAGNAAQVQFRLRNRATIPAVLSYLEVRGSGFGLKDPVALPITLAAQAAVDFEVTFSAPDTGMYSAALVSEGISVILTVTVVAAPPLPAMRIVVDLARTGSGQQGSAAVRFDAPAPRGGMGTLTLDFQPGRSGTTDAAIAFSAGTRSTAFTFNRGDTQCRFGDQPGALFQTGTTAGVLTFTAKLGATSAQTTVTIGPAPVGITEARGTRSADSVEIRVLGFDNTRTAGSLSFTFFDAAGTALAPGTIRTDATSAFQQFYQNSDVGGTFSLRAVFPVSGDVSQIAAFEASIGNSEGVTGGARTKF